MENLRENTATAVMASRREPLNRKSDAVKILEKLQLLVDEGVFSEDDRFNKLKGEIKEVVDFFLNVLDLEDSFSGLVDFSRLFDACFGSDRALSRFDSIGAASIFRDFLKNFRQQTGCLADSVHQNWQGFYSLLFKDGLPPTGADSCFGESLENFRQQIRDFYDRMWDFLVQIFLESRMRYLQLRGVYDWEDEWEETYYEGEVFICRFISFLQKVEKILHLGEICDSRFAADLEPVRMNLVSLEDFKFNKIGFIRQCPGMAQFAAHLCCWFFRDGIHLKTSASVENINPAADPAPLTCIDSIIDFCKDDHGLNELKVELRLVKVFFLCARKLFYSFKSAELVEDSLHQNWQQFYSFLLQLERGSPPSELAGAISNLRTILKSYRQKLNKLYVEMSDFSLKSVCQGHDWPDYCRRSRDTRLDRFLKSRSGSRDEFMEFFYFVLENLVDIVLWAEACGSRLEKLLEPLQEKLVFLKNFILFASLQGKHKRKLMEHCAVVALSAAYFCYICWFFRYDNQELDRMDLKLSELIGKITPVDHRARVTYIRVLESGATSLALCTKKDAIIVGEFVDSLLGHLWELLLNCPPCFMVSLKHQLRMLYEGLRFFRNFLNKEKYDGLDERIKDLVGAVVNDAGIIIFSLYQRDIQEASTKKMDVQLFCLLEKIKLIKAEIDEKYPVVSNFNSPTTNAPGLIILLQEKLKELASCKVDPVFSFAEDRVHFLRSYLQNAMEQHNQDAQLQAQTTQEDLLFLKSFLENNLEQQIEKGKLKIQTMQRGLGFLRSFLVNNKDERNCPEELQALRSSVMEVAYKTEFVIDSLIVGDVSLYSLMLLDQVTEEIKLLETKMGMFDSINAQKLTNNSGDVPSQAGSKWTGGFHLVPSEGIISTINKASVYLKDQEEEIISQLTKGSMQLDIISIVGMAGLGKTFLAQRVYLDPSVKSHFHIQAWCCVSQTYCKKDLLLEILACIDPKAQYSEMNQDDLAHKLCKYLSRKKYLIVLDDVWDIEVWNALKISFPNHANGSRILLTSRYDGISGTAHHLRPLDEEESWELLKKKLSITIEDSYPIELSARGRQIAKNCNGLPLSIVIMSGILGTLDQGCWEEVAERLDANSKIGATEQCKSILELSYIHLPDHLKPCLLYFSAFREDQEISVKRLMRLWIAEGFVQKKELESVENLPEGFVQKKEQGSVEKLAEGYLKALINRSLVMEGQQRSIGEAKTCHIHDLLHVFCLGKAKDQNFLQLVRGYDGFLNFDEPNYLHRLSIHSQPKHFVKSRIFCPHVRSLLHSSHGVGSRVVSYSLSFVCLLKLLQVLDLEQINLGFTFPCELGLLIQLRYLAVSGRIKYIPPSLENLSNLETFLVTTYCSDVGLSSLQDIFWKLQKLRHLQVRGALIDLRLPRDSLESSCILSNLQTFSTPKLCLGQSMEKMMMKFPNIHRLKCCLLESEESSSDCTRIVAMDSLSQLESLKLLLGEVTTSPIEFHLPLNLKKLTLEDFSWSIICTIRKLPNLEVLKLIRQTDGEEEWDMGDMEDMEDMEEEEFFPKLKFLRLESLKMVKWMGSGGHFPSLERLILYDCVELEELPSCLCETLTLQLIEVHGCLYSAGELVRDIKKQQMDYGKKDLKILISEEIEESFSWSDGDSDGWSG